MTDSGPAKLLIVIGLMITAFGLIYYYFGSYLRWLGRLPGDIRIERENFNFYFPLTTMILLSLILNLVVRIFRYFKG